MTNDTHNSFTDSRAAARALLALEGFTEREGQFLGGLAFRPYPLSDKQLRWLSILLDRHDLPALVDGGAS